MLGVEGASRPMSLTPLPIDAALPDFLAALRRSPNVVLRAQLAPVKRLASHPLCWTAT